VVKLRHLSVIVTARCRDLSVIITV